MTTSTRNRDNIIGREIYERIKDLSNPQRIEYFKTISTEYKELYKKYNNTIRQQKYKQDEANKQKANDKAKEGMKAFRASRTPDEVKKHLEIRKIYDKRFEAKRKMTREEASSVIQKQYRKNKQEQKKKKEAQAIANDILNDIINTSFDKKIVNGELKQKSNSNEMLFNIDQVIAYVSKYITLKIGDLIFTGTPSGVGPVAIGDVLSGNIEGEKMFEFIVR